MNIHTAYTIYNNGIQTVEPQLAEAIDRIIDDKNKQLENLDRVELAEVKARIEIEAIDGYYSALLKKRVLQVEALQIENDRLRVALDEISDLENFYGHDKSYYQNLLSKAIVISCKALAGESK